MAYKRKTPEEKQKEIEELTSSIDGKINGFFEDEQSIAEPIIKNMIESNNFVQNQLKNE